MDYSIIKKLIEEEIIDFNKMLLKNYKKIGLTELEAFLLMELFNQKKAGDTFISPSKLVKKITVSQEKLLQTLEALITKKYLTIRLVKQENDKDTEDFSLDNTVYKLIQVYRTLIKHEVIDTDKTYDSLEAEIVDLLEQQFQKQLKPLEIELIQKWINEDDYSVDDIKAATLDAIKANKTSISYVDGVLLKRSKNKKKAPKKQYDTEKSEALKAFFDSWEQK